MSYCLSTAMICFIWPSQFSVIKANHASGTWSPPQHIDINAYWGRLVFWAGWPPQRPKWCSSSAWPSYLPASPFPWFVVFCKTALRHQLFRCPSSLTKLQDVSLLPVSLHIWDHFHYLPRLVTTVWLCHLFFLYKSIIFHFFQLCPFLAWWYVEWQELL